VKLCYLSRYIEVTLDGLEDQRLFDGGPFMGSTQGDAATRSDGKRGVGLFCVRG
jgi:hypothetical protein